MFTRRSRYYRLTDTYAIDRNGRRYASKSLRLNPELTANFNHTLDASDRLDHLAYKYYKQSLHWWRICDANETKSPRELIDKTPIKTIRVSIRWSGAIVPWSDLFSMLGDLKGVIKVSKGTTEMKVPEKEIIIGPAMFAIGIAFLVELQQSSLIQSLTAPLHAELSLNGLTVAGEIKIHVLGPELWRIEEMQSGNAYFIRLTEGISPAPDTLNIFEGLARYDWVLDIQYNENVFSYEEIGNHIEALGFLVQGLEKIGRTGKAVLIPSRFIG